MKEINHSFLESLWDEAAKSPRRRMNWDMRLRTSLSNVKSFYVHVVYMMNRIIEKH